MWQLRNRLPTAWRPFFGRFGNLRPVQLEAMPQILDGRSVALFTPTASGKTEAVVAPLAELIGSRRWMATSVLYIVPTRALANDLDRRLVGACEDAGVSCAIKHGESGVLAALPGTDIVITTPESLDSITCRATGLLANVRAVVLDEIHLIDGTYRGDQLRVLVERLGRADACGPPAVHLMSATVPDPEAVAVRYSPGAIVVQGEAPRGLEGHILPSLKDAIDLCKSRRWFKVLVFCSARRTVEGMAQEIGPLWHPYPTVCHHGSLSRLERREAESVMRESRVAVCVATSTLEVGIDIGDIDVVLLADPPWSLSSLVQRAGRGRRRGAEARCIALAGSDEEREVLSRMLESAAAGTLEARPYRPDLSVVVQQVFSILFQFPQGVERHELTNIVASLADEETAAEIVAHLGEKGWLTHIAERIYACDRLLDLNQRGRLHSNIPDREECRVVDVESGREIGTVSGRVDERFLLAKRMWSIVSRHPGLIRVRRCSGPPVPAVFKPTDQKGAFWMFLPPRIREAEESARTGS